MGAKVVAIASGRRERAEAVAKEFGIEHVAADWQELVQRDDVDLVSIVTPPSTHMEITLAALEQHKAVLCEKPMAMNAEQSARMTEKAQAAGVLALIDHELRFLNSRRTMRGMLQTGAIGSVRHCNYVFRSDYRALPDVKRTVVLKDTNDRELAKLELVTNAFGSLSGSFTAPANGITGRMTIRDGNDMTSIRVEEYKRPKFKVEVLPPAVAPKLGEAVSVKVQALGYTGAPVDGAKVVGQHEAAEFTECARHFDPGGPTPDHDERQQAPASVGVGLSFGGLEGQ
jgi:hypothetical protein